MDGKKLLDRRLRILPMVGPGAAAALVLIAGCAIEGGAGPTAPAVPASRASVEREFLALSRGLRDNTWSRVEHFFSRGFQGGYEELRDRFEDQRRTERIIDLQFIVNRILESDRRLNVQVKWNKAFTDRQGRPGKATGTAEVVLEPAGDTYRILSIRGDSFL